MTVKHPVPAAQRLAGLAALLVAGFPQAGFAQSDDGAFAPEEIVVTATRRERNLQDVPASITAFTGDDLRSRGVYSSNDIARVTPGLTVQTGFGITAPQIRIRGVGSAGFTADVVGAVGIYMDEIYLNSNLGHGFHIYDVEQVEVLRGPQGTVYGANTTGGALNYIFKKPSGEFGAEASVSIGAFGLQTVEAAAEVPLNDDWAFRGSYYSNQIDGWGTNVFLDRDEDFYDLSAVRLQALYEPNEKLSVLFRVHQGQNRGDSLVAEPVGILDPASVAAGVPVACSTQQITALQCVDANGYNGALGFFDGTRFDGAGAPDPFDTAQDHINRGDVDVFGASARIEWSAGGLDFVSITAYEELDRAESFDIEGSPLDFWMEEYVSDVEQISQEFRVSSDAADAFNWVAGAFYLREDAFDFYYEIFNDAGGPRSGPGFSDGRYFTLDTESTAVFADVSYSFSERLTLSGGLRYSRETKKTDYVAAAFDKSETRNDRTVSLDFFSANETARFVTINDLEETWSEVTGRLTLEYRPSDAWLTYVSATRGYRGGTIPSFEFAQDDFVFVNPEFVDSYEIGAKGSFWDRLGVFNISAFFMDYTDQQVQTSVGGKTFLDNVGESEISGAEMELQLLPTERLSLNFGLSLLDAEFTANAPSIGIAAGNKLESSPDVSFNGLVRYEIPVGENTVALQADANFQDDVFLDIANDPEALEPGYWVHNANIEYIGDKYELSLWVRNLTDETYRVNWFSVRGEFAGFLGNWYGDPRTYGVTFSAKID